MSARPELVSSAMSDELSFERASATPATRARHVDEARGAGRPRAASSPAMRELSLAEVQAWFQAVVTHPAAVAAGVEHAGVAVEAMLDPTTTTGAYEGLGVYHHAYRARLVECLADDYPALQFALGPDAFESLASRYITTHPSRSSSLNGFGRHFEDFCRQQEPGRPSFLGDLAMLEWSLVEVLHAEDAPPLAVDALSRLAPERWSDARLLPSQTLRLCRFDYPVNDFFQAYKDGLAPERPAPGAQELAIYRRGFTLWRMTLGPSMARLLRSLVGGTPLGRALAEVEAAATEPLLPEDVMAWFGAWVQGGFFARVELPAEAT